mmetsp:Transcript_8531/g.13334  ORF Transcript_8531/g.13334 Transcript_8531/m.13334 type:complete len:439 (+) Transcript_8531:157-1473(+)|eukprot:CAMPEP_0194208942 /NCGR_PEP_ID=MMETSP0156-20130528/7235_1 /TAXON_ID=33649 /ORGANISM="Thalassionema nitzschioides, Strain L26-B" /LENGTH=438 /DNA_ID=CAMNT_0038936011 /DNA_START=178 /DNA_END=1497 /DNA_ORIENTATION=+
MTSDTDMNSLGNRDEKNPFRGGTDECENNDDGKITGSTKNNEESSEDEKFGLSGRSNNKKTDRSKAGEDGEEKIPIAFPQRLMKILSNKDYAEIISWLPHGNGFIIYQKRRFATEIMPKYFKKAKFTSFTRKLNRWSFIRITRGPETGAYYNQFFRRGNIPLCSQMRCQSSQDLSSTTQQESFGIPPTSIQASSSAGLLGGRAASELINISNAGLSTTAAVRMSDVSSPLRPTALGILHEQLGTLQTNSGINQNAPTIDKLRQLEYQRRFLLLRQQQEQRLQQQELTRLNEEIQHQKQLLDLTLKSNRQPTILENASTRKSGFPDIGLNALNNSNTNSYLALLMAQEKLQQAGLATVSHLPAEAIDSANKFQNQQLMLLQMKQQHRKLLEEKATIEHQMSGFKRVGNFDDEGDSSPNCKGSSKSPDKKRREGKFSAAA